MLAVHGSHVYTGGLRKQGTIDTCEAHAKARWWQFKVYAQNTSGGIFSRGLISLALTRDLKTRRLFPVGRVLGVGLRKLHGGRPTDQVWPPPDVAGSPGFP